MAHTNIPARLRRTILSGSPKRRHRDPDERRGGSIDYSLAVGRPA
jgi:hypothetical protein